jgi:hypothetical protein
MSGIQFVNRDAFLRDLRRYCRKNALSFEWNAARGKGGHGTVTVNGVSTVVPSTIKQGLSEAILKQLGLPKDAL